MSEYRDGSIFKSNDLYKKNNNAIQIQLYYDEFVATNQINNCALSYKICAIYYLLGNLHPKYK